MSADKRSVSTDALETLGTIIGEGEKRDAIHLAVEPVICGQYPIGPSERIYLKDGLAYPFDNTMKALGIADPFLSDTITPGQRFWLVVFPRQIKSLRHVWEHPDFPASELGLAAPAVSNEESQLPTTGDDPKVAASKAWVEEYAKTLSEGAYEEHNSITYDDLMSHAETWINPGKWGGDYLVKGGTLEGVYLDESFWMHFYIITGKVPEGHNIGEGPSFFSCSC